MGAMTEDIYNEHRFHQRLQKYWNSLRGALPFPQESAINPDEISDIWASCFLISLDSVTERLGYRYSYMGSQLLEAYGADPDHGGSTSQLISTPYGTMIAKYDEARAKKAPVIDENEFVNARNVAVRYRSCILPLGRPDGTLTHLIGCMRWKMY